MYQGKEKRELERKKKVIIIMFRSKESVSGKSMARRKSEG